MARGGRAGRAKEGGRAGEQAWWRSAGASPRCGSQVHVRGPSGKGRPCSPEPQRFGGLSSAGGPKRVDRCP